MAIGHGGALNTQRIGAVRTHVVALTARQLPAKFAYITAEAAMVDYCPCASNGVPRTERHRASDRHRELAAMNMAELVPTYRARLQALPETAAPSVWWDVLAELAAVPVSGLDLEHNSDQLLFEATGTPQTVANTPGYALDITREVLPGGGACERDLLVCLCTGGQRGERADLGCSQLATDWVAKVQASAAFPVLATSAIAVVIDARGTLS